MCTTADSVCKSGSNGVYVATVTSPSDFREAYFGGVHGIRAKGPTFPAGWSVTSGGTYTAASNSTTPTSSWTNVSNIEIVSQQGWQTTYCPISSISSTTINMQTPCITNWARAFYPQVYIGMQTPAWVENAYELLPSCGQGCWYLNKTTHTLFYIPITGQNMSTLDVEVPAVFQLLTGSGASNITFSRISFEYSTWLDPDSSGNGYVEMQNGYHCSNPAPTNCRQDNATLGNPLPAAVDFSNGSNNITFSHNLFTHLSARPLFFEHGSRSNMIYANLFTDNAGQAAQVGDITDYAQSDTALQTNGNTIKDNEVGPPFEYLSSGGIFVPIATNTVITHNYIPNNTWVPITTGWWGWIAEGGNHTTYNANNMITDNRITTPCHTWPLEDCGSIYNNGNQTSTLYSGNYSLGDGGNSANHMQGCWYPDEGSSDMSWTGNVCDGGATGRPNYFAYLWISSISNQTMAGNYSTTSSYLDNGTNDMIRGNTAYSFGIPPSGATAIINAAGIEAGVTPGP